MATSTPPKGNSAPKGNPANRDRSPKRPTPQQSHARAAKARQEQERKKRQRVVMAGIAGAVVLAVVVVLIAVKLTSNSGGGTPTSALGKYVPEPAPGAVVTTLDGIPATSLASAVTKYGQALSGAPHAVNGVPPPGQTPGGPPVFFYYGANYCPYCAAERWAMVVALSKFGTFSNLGQTTSSAIDTDPNTPTFTFYQSTYSSPYINFVPLETTTNQPSGNGYQPLMVPSAAQTQVVAANDPNGSIPFIYIAGKFLQTGTPYDPAILAGKSMNDIAQEAADTSTKIGQNVQAAAGTLVQDICAVTKNQPANVCSAFGSASGG